MKKVIAVLLAVSTLFLLCSCSNPIISRDVSKADRELLKVVHEELMRSKFKTVFKMASSPIDVEQIVTFSEDTITYQVTRATTEGEKFTYSDKIPYSLSMKKEHPYIIVGSETYECLYVVLIDENQREDGKDIIDGLKGEKSQMGFKYDRIK